MLVKSMLAFCLLFFVRAELFDLFAIIESEFCFVFLVLFVFFLHCACVCVLFELLRR